MSWRSKERKDDRQQHHQCQGVVFKELRVLAKSEVGHIKQQDDHEESDGQQHVEQRLHQGFLGGGPGDGRHLGQ